MARKPTGKPTGRPQAGDLKGAEDALNKMSSQAEIEQDNQQDFEGLSERQQLIARFRLRGLSQKQIAKFLKVSQPVISKELKRIRTHMQERGASVDGDRFVGETTSLYEEIEHRAWEIYSTGEGSDKIKALNLVMTAREKQAKLLMDLGRIERAGSKSTVEVHVNPFVEKLQAEDKKQIVENIIHSQLTKLDEPEPPQLSADTGIEDAEFEEDD